MERQTQLLNGWWDYRIADGKYSKKYVPYSDFAVGVSECRLNFNRNVDDYKRAFLVFDGITYSADVTFNSVYLGNMLPYCEYRYEITDILKENDNTLSVIIKDTEVVFGAGEGWENYSGITRDVYIEYLDSSFVEDVWWRSDLENEFTLGKTTVELTINNPTSSLFAEIKLTGSRDEVIYCEKIKADSESILFNKDVEMPWLWSPEAPNLYSLTVTLIDGDKIIDIRNQKVGFKEFKTVGKRFYLNGKPTFITGMCRHEIYGDSGHMMTDEQIYADLKLIKDGGCNYVRLVHYPHRKRTLEIADEIGILVSEEPGLWWSDMKDMDIVNSSLEVLKRTILRDRSHISVAFWLSFNECRFTREFLLASAEVCRKYDPYRMVSGANCMDIPTTKTLFSECGFDFYTMHPYSERINRMIESAVELCDKPLLLTEWAGYFAIENQRLFCDFVNKMREFWHNTEDKPVIAGASVWCFAELNELTRGEPACYDSILREGLVDKYRNPLPIYHVFKDMFSKINIPPEKDKTFVQITNFLSDSESITPVALDSHSNSDEQNEAYEEMIARGKENIPKYTMGRGYRRVKYGPVLPHKIKNVGEIAADLLCKPLVINEKAKICIDIPETSKSIFIFGNSSMPKGFPAAGIFGENVYTVTLCYDDGTSEDVIMRNGQEVTTASACFGPSRINPVASNAPRAIHFINDLGGEYYVVNLFKINVQNGKKANKVILHSASEGYSVLLYGISVES